MAETFYTHAVRKVLLSIKLRRTVWLLLYCVYCQCFNCFKLRMTTFIKRILIDCRLNICDTYCVNVCVCVPLIDRSTTVVSVRCLRLAGVNEKVTWRRRWLWPVPYERQSSLPNDAWDVYVPCASWRCRPVRGLSDETVSSGRIGAALHCHRQRLDALTRRPARAYPASHTHSHSSCRLQVLMLSLPGFNRETFSSITTRQCRILRCWFQAAVHTLKRNTDCSL